MLLQRCDTAASRVQTVSLRSFQTVCVDQCVSLLSKNSMYSLLAPVAVGQLRDSRGRKSTTIHPLQSLSAPLPGAETGPCKCSLFWQAHPLHLHGTPYKAPRDKVTFFLCFFFFLFSFTLSSVRKSCQFGQSRFSSNGSMLAWLSQLLSFIKILIYFYHWFFSSVPLFHPCELFCAPHIETHCVTFGFCLAEGTPNIITMVYGWNQTPHSTDSKKTCSIWPSDSSLPSRNRGSAVH